MSLESLASFPWHKPRHPCRWVPVPPPSSPPTILGGEPVEHRAALVPSKEPDEWIAYYPLEDSPALFVELADCADDDALAAFGTKFGTLGLWLEPGFSEEPEVTLEDGSKGRGESLAFWQYVQRDLQRAVHLHEAIVAQDTQRVEELGQEIPPYPTQDTHLGSPGSVVFWQTESDENRSLARGWPSGDKHALHHGRIALAQRINNVLRRRIGVGSVVALTSERFSIQLWPRTLLGCAWYQFAAVVEGSAEVKRCVACDSPFLVTHRSDRRGHRRYCTDACKQRGYRARRAERATETAKRQRKSARKSRAAKQGRK
ncbi:MAG: hypothetical protein IH974_07460 [Myxococcales bacterium]|nr:hypothetical protein [Myxococcales bacterium]